MDHQESYWDTGDDCEIGISSALFGKIEKMLEDENKRIDLDFQKTAREIAIDSVENCQPELRIVNGQVCHYLCVPGIYKFVSIPVPLKYEHRSAAEIAGLVAGIRSLADMIEAQNQANNT